MYKQPRTAFVANFLGAVNILHGYIKNGVLYIDNFERKVDNYYGIDDVIVDVRQNEMAITKEKIHNAIRGKI